jgi:hypothetical protein
MGFRAILSSKDLFSIGYCGSRTILNFNSHTQSLNLRYLAGAVNVWWDTRVRREDCVYQRYHMISHMTRDSRNYLCTTSMISIIIIINKSRVYVSYEQAKH